MQQAPTLSEMGLADDLRYLLRAIRHPNKAMFLVGAVVSYWSRYLPGWLGRATASAGRRIVLVSPTNRRAIDRAVNTINHALLDEEQRRREAEHGR